MNAMWLCATHMCEVDAGVQVVLIPRQEEMMGDPDALFYALVRAEIKRLTDSSGAPNEKRWDQQRNRMLPETRAVKRRLKKTWGELCAEVSFQKEPRG